MPHVIRTHRRELSAQEIIDHVEAGGRVLIELGKEQEARKLSIRKHAGTYYCDTPLKLHTHSTAEELRSCLEQFQLVRQSRESVRREGTEAD